MHQRRPAERFLRTLLFTVGSALLAIALFNFFVNPYGYYPSRLVPPLYPPDQIIKPDLMRAARPAEVLILGSSRAKKLAPAVVTEITGLSAFNAGVSSARTEDWYAMLRYALDLPHWQPRVLVIGIDVEAFHPTVQPMAVLAGNAALGRYLPLAVRWRGVRSELPQILALGQAVDGMQALGLPLGPPPQVLEVFDPDGLVHYVSQERRMAEGTFVLQPERTIPAYRERLQDMTHLDAGRRAMFEQVVQLAAARGIRVYGFITSLHPVVVDDLRQTRDFDRRIAELTTYLNGLQAAYPNFSYRDFTSVAAYGGDPKDWIDGAHIGPQNARRLLRALLTP